MRNVLLTFALLLCFAFSADAQIKVITNGDTGIGTSTPIAKLHVGGNIALDNQSTANNGEIRNHKVFGVDDSKRIQLSTATNTQLSSSYFQMFGDETNAAGQAARAGEFVLAGKYIDMRVNNTNSSFGNIEWQLDAAGNVTNFGGNTSSSFRIIADADKLAKNSGSFKYGLNEIMQMEPKRFTADVAKKNSQVESVGVFAQDIAKIAPELVSVVSHVDYENNINEKYQAVDMTAITFMLVNSIKEQQELIEAQNERIAEMEATIINLANGTTTQAVEVKDSRLGQNAPNPFNQSTVINYTVPTKSNTAVLQIFDLNGQVLKTVNVANGNGQLTINAGELAAGTYSYNLVVDGAVVDTKKMVLTK